MAKQRWILTFLLIGGLVASLPVAAQRYYQGDDGRRDRSELRSGYQDLDSAVSRIRKRTGGRVLSAETQHRERGPVHHIRVLTDKGKVKRYRIDARSGRLLKKGSGR